MQNPTVINRCTVQMRSGKFCDEPSRDDMPFPICGHHARKLFEHMRPDIPAPETAREVWDIFQAHYEEYRPVMTAAHLEKARLYGEQSQVYYLQLPGDLIKIGVTVNLKERLSALRLSRDAVLATEPGWQDAEAQRHKQFAHLRQGRLENFTAAPDLLDLIAKLRAQFGPPKITTYIQLAS